MVGMSVLMSVAPLITGGIAMPIRCLGVCEVMLQVSFSCLDLRIRDADLVDSEGVIS